MKTKTALPLPAAARQLARARAALSSGLFDHNYYQERRGHTFKYPGAAAADFMQVGWRQNLNPSARFDTAFYLAHCPVLAGGDIDPLTHFLEIGKKQGLRPRGGRGLIWDERSEIRSETFQERFPTQRSRLEGLDPTDCVDVVVPVYGGYRETLRCIESVLEATSLTPFRLVVIEDASPDAKLSAALKGLQRDDLIDLERNRINQGFVKTANLGFSFSQIPDVILLNADAEVYSDWIDRLRRHAQSSARVATVTPFSNNATILSYPYTLESNNIQLEMSPSALDQMFAQTFPGERADIPTGVGFCFYVTRASLDELGGFDPAFGRGYGEENDFCRRAAASGWRNLAACDVYVGHRGEVSFAAESRAAKQVGLAEVVARHPDYLTLVNAFIGEDPLASYRQRMDMARVGRALPPTAILHLEHGWGGGLTSHVQDLTTRLGAEGVESFRAQPDGHGGLTVRFAGELDLPNLPALRLDEPQILAEGFRALPIRHIHIHSLVGWSLEQMQVLLAAASLAGLAFDFTVHDYASICPRVHMIDWSGVYCDSPAAAYCRRCISLAGSLSGASDVDAWRETYLAVLLAARRVIVPDPDVAVRLQRYVPQVANPLIRPHPKLAHKAAPVANVVPACDPRLAIAVIGSIGANKGSQVLLSLAADALQRDLPIRFDIIGETSIWADGEWPNVYITGRYAEDEVDALIKARGCAFAFFPAVWPETFCYTLDIATRNHLACLAFDIGALGRRIDMLGLGQLLPLELAQHPDKINDALLAFNPARYPARTNELAEPGRIWHSASNYYDWPSS